MKQKIALSLPGQPPTVDMQSVVDATVDPLRQKIEELQSQLADVQAQVAAASQQVKPP